MGRFVMAIDPLCLAFTWEDNTRKALPNVHFL